MNLDAPFHTVPYGRFFRRILFPLVIAYCAGFLLLGFFFPAPNLGVIESARKFQFTVISQWQSVPAPCISGEVRSDFEAGRCKETMDKLWNRTLFALIPFFAALVFIFISFDIMVITYRKLRRRIKSGQSIGIATIKKAEELNDNFYGWFFCFKSIEAELPNKRRIRVYFPKDYQGLLTGQKIALFSVGSRVFGILYSSNVVVVKGS